ncbi:MAG: DUF4286 family protein [Chitinophagaceae bacterium]|nr:DUF4286 family protein [Chitinophagaceae bacterium]
MIVYNITVKVENEISAEWVQWQLTEHIPEIMATGLFTNHQFFKLLDQDSEDGVTYVSQYFTNSRNNYDAYIKNFSGELRNKAINKWGNRFIAFRTLMQSVQ